MILEMISAVSASVKYNSQPVVLEGKTLIRSVSIQKRVSNGSSADGGNVLCKSVSLSESPYVLPGKTPTEIKDMKTVIATIS